MSPRGTSNSNERGSAANRRARKLWLLDTYRANVDLHIDEDGVQTEVPHGEGHPAARCFHCGCLLTIATLTVDRIIASVNGGTYRRNNIRPACLHDNSILGSKLRDELAAARLAKRAVSA